jgi:hypothetical protein
MTLDPNACLREMVDAYGKSDLRTATALMVALDDWLNSGGFAPEWDLGSLEMFAMLRERHSLFSSK